MRVFIRSSRQSIPIMEQVAICIERCGHCPIRWDDENAFLPGEYTHETLARLASQVDAALFIFAGDDKVWYHESTSLQPRDNVLVEYGLFSGTLGRKSVIICRCQSAKIASDLLGINYIEYSEHTNIFTRYLRRWFDSISSKAMESVPPLFYDTSGNPLFAQEVKTLVKRAKHIFMMGMGLDILSNLSLVDELLDRSLSGSCTVAVYVGDPYNPTIESRLIEEERGDKAPWVKKAGLISRLRKLLLDWDRAGRPNSFSVKVFTNYPTFALLVFDEDYFIYPYAYSMLGNFSPVMRFAESNPQHQQIVHFLRKQKEAIERDAIDAFSEYHVRNHKSSGVFRQLASTLDNNALAVYFIPPKDSLLYEAGSLIVGYDVRESTPVVSPWGGYQGDACLYGIHLTICDCLYFLNAAEREKAIAEIKAICEGMGQFEIAIDLPKMGYPGNSAVSIPVTDISGNLTTLHNDFVCRVYPRAAATDDLRAVTGDLKHFDSALHRSFFLEYGAPYVMNNYRPHFTLIRRLPSDQSEALAVFSSVSEQFGDISTSCQISVRSLSIMEFHHKENRWELSEEVDLTRVGG